MLHADENRRDNFKIKSANIRFLSKLTVIAIFKRFCVLYFIIL